MFEINVVKIGKIDVHFAYISVQLVPVQIVFSLILHQIYIESFFMRRKLYKKFSDLTPLKDEQFDYLPKMLKFLIQNLVCYLQSDGIIDADQQDFCVGMGVRCPRGLGLFCMQHLSNRSYNAMFKY